MTECDKCGSKEITVASIGSRCMYCPNGIMRSKNMKLGVYKYRGERLDKE